MDGSDYKICTECGGKMVPSATTMTFQGYFCCECGENVFTSKEICALQKLIKTADFLKTEGE